VKEQQVATKSKSETILELLNTGMSIREITQRLAVSYSYVHAIKKAMVHKADETALAIQVSQGKQRDRQEGGDHYKRLGVEPWDVYDTWPLEQRVGAYRANCTKYVMRLDQKDTPLLNAKKLAHYAQKLVEVLEQAG
jgi:hypothetical protein